ncbi:amino-acid permease inda1 [Fusarium albosuccineum]|uniref:Amino-acid permease inda1 n=1 Tax=Fusarium albosuccineum TaxID=1237068 RepID=A0A8H4L092_9HYPO|nr:amino-acid permease inda1 [Fusarium albosuccineum]
MDPEKQAIPSTIDAKPHGKQLPLGLILNDAAPSIQNEGLGAQEQQAFENETFMTLNGLNLQSFQRRHYGRGIIELDRKMKPRHLNMIAIGGSIVAGFYVGSGSALSRGPRKPLPGLSDRRYHGLQLYALGEMAIMFPISGGFYTYCVRFIDPSWGFAVAWNYVLQWAVTLPLELTVCAITIGYWDSETSPGVWITVFLLAIAIINVFGALGYAEEEFWAACFKLSSTVIFMTIAVILICGGGPSTGRYDQYTGARLWHDPGAFKNGFKGFCSVFVTAAASFAGTELVGLAAAESKNPTKAVPSAIKQVFWRISLFYILGLFLIGLLIDCNDKSLLSASAYSDSQASPFVLVGKYAGLRGLDHFINVVILSSVLSIGIASVYGGSRTLTALCQQSYGPKLFTYIDRAGRPLPSVGVIIACGLLAYINLSAQGPVIFDWLLSLSGIGILFTWASICLAHIRFRAAWKYQGHSLDEIPFRAIGGVYGSWVGLIFVFLVLIAQLAQFYVSIMAPPGESGMGTVEGFFKSYLTLPIMLFLWATGYLWKRAGWLRVADIDVDTGRREHDWDAIHVERARISQLPIWRRLYYILF